MSHRKPRRSKLAINDLSVLLIWVLIGYLIYRASPAEFEGPVRRVGQALRDAFCHIERCLPE